MELLRKGRYSAHFKGQTAVSVSLAAALACLSLQGCESTSALNLQNSNSGSPVTRTTFAQRNVDDVAPGPAANSKPSRTQKPISNPPVKTGGGDTSMRGSVQSALYHSADVKSAESRFSEAGINVSIAKAGYMPTLQSSIGGGTSDSYDYSVSVGQPLYDFGQTRSRVAQASSGKAASSEELRATREDISLKASRAFISIKRYEALVDAAREDIAVHERFVRLASTRSQGGISDATEVQLANVHLGEAQSSLEDAEGYLRAARSTYHSYVGYPAGDLADVPELKLNLAATADLETSVVSAPTVKLAEARGDEAQNAANAEKASLFPRLSAEAFYRGGDNYSSDKSGIGVRLTGPTFNGFSNFQRVQAMNVAAESSRWNAEAARRNVALQVREFTDRTPTLKNQIGILSMQQEKAKKLRSLYEEQFKMGERNFLDLITVQSDVIRLERSKINAKYDILDLQYSAASALGVLQQQLAISE